jgi:RNA polymerase sigma factor (sigma-70 family)
MTPKKPTDHSAQLTELWTDHYEKLERTTATWAGRHRHDPDVQDAIQNTYLRTLRFLSRGGTFNDSPSGWLITVARREFHRILGREGRTSELYTDDKSRALIDPGPEPDEVVLDHAHSTLDGALEKALARLTPRERAVLTDVHAGYSYTEIQQRRNLSRTALNKTLTNGRTRLRHDGALEQAYRQWSD